MQKLNQLREQLGENINIADNNFCGVFPLKPSLQFLVAFGFLNLVGSFGQVFRAYNANMPHFAILYALIAAGNTLMVYLAFQWLKNCTWESRRQLIQSIQVAIVMAIAQAVVSSIIMFEQADELLKRKETHEGKKMTDSEKSITKHTTIGTIIFIFIVNITFNFYTLKMANVYTAIADEEDPDAVDYYVLQE